MLTKTNQRGRFGTYIKSTSINYWDLPIIASQSGLYSPYQLEMFGPIGAYQSSIQSSNSLAWHLASQQLILHNIAAAATMSVMAAWSTQLTLMCTAVWGAYSPFSQALIIRGIGFRAHVLENDWNATAVTMNRPLIFVESAINTTQVVASEPVEETDWDEVSQHEFPYSRYLSVRVGHSFHLYLPLPDSIGVSMSKKDRKLVVYGPDKQQVANFAYQLHQLRPPSVYTGRGIRQKKITPRRKLGKKDIRKGRIF